MDGGPNRRNKAAFSNFPGRSVDTALDQAHSLLGRFLGPSRNLPWKECVTNHKNGLRGD